MRPGSRPLSRQALTKAMHKKETRSGAPPREAKTSLLSLPNELLLELLSGHRSSLDEERQVSRQKVGLSDEWFTLNAWPISRYTVPWLEEHHPIAMPLSQTCSRLRALMLPCIWQEVGLSTLEELARVRDGLRMFPERGEFILRLEWSWLLKHPVWQDRQYRTQHRLQQQPCFRSLEALLEPPMRWPKQPLETEEECVGAITEVVCRLPNLETLLWVSPYLHMTDEVVDFLAQKEVPLTSFQVDVCPTGDPDLSPALVPFWKFASRLERLAFRFISLDCRTAWSESDMARWRAYDDQLSGAQAFCEDVLKKEVRGMREENGRMLKKNNSKIELATREAHERQSAVAYKTIMAACEGSLRSLTLSPLWVFATPALAHYWVKLDESRLIHQRQDVGDVEFDRHMSLAPLGREGFSAPMDEYSYARAAQWDLGALAIRPALYHASRHRSKAGRLTAKDVQALADRPPEYPLSLFYPCFRDASVAQRMVEMWESLVERGESERVQCQCAECQAGV